MSSKKMFEALRFLSDEPLDDISSPTEDAPVTTTEVDVHVAVTKEQQEVEEIAVEEDAIEDMEVEADSTIETAMRMMSYLSLIKRDKISRASFAAMNYDGFMDKVLLMQGKTIIAKESIDVMPSKGTITASLESALGEGIKTFKDTMVKWAKAFWEMLKSWGAKVKHRIMQIRTKLTQMKNVLAANTKWENTIPEEYKETQIYKARDVIDFLREFKFDVAMDKVGQPSAFTTPGQYNIDGPMVKIGEAGYTKDNLKNILQRLFDCGDPEKFDKQLSDIDKNIKELVTEIGAISDSDDNKEKLDALHEKKNRLNNQRRFSAIMIAGYMKAFQSASLAFKIYTGSSSIAPPAPQQ